MIKDLCSICCLSYNHADYIQYSIESFFNQSYKNIEIIALDDGSSDNSVDILNNLSQSSSVPFTVIAQNNTGNIGANFNTLLKKSQGEYIIFIALDDALTPDFLKEQIQKHTIEKRYYAIVCGNIESDTGTINEPIGRHKTRPEKMAVTPDGKPSVTHYTVLERFGSHTFLDINLETGRRSFEER